MNSFLHKWKGTFVFAAGLSCLINLLQLTFSFYMFVIYGSIVQSFSYSTLYACTVLALFAILFLVFFLNLRSRLFRSAATDLEKRMRPPIQRGMIRSMTGPQKQSYSQGLSDISALSNFLRGDAITTIFDLPWAPFYLILIFLFHPLLGIFSLTCTFLCAVLTLFQERKTRHPLLQANKLAQQNQVFLGNSLNNAEAVNAMGMAPAIHTHFERQNRQIIEHQTNASRVAGGTQSALKSIQIFVNVMIYGVGAWLVIKENFNPGMMIAASMIMGQATAPIMRALAQGKSMTMTYAAYKRLLQFSLWHEEQQKKRPFPLGTPRGDLQVRGLFFAHGGHMVLRNISFDLQAGQFLGLIGANGAGKSTLSRILLGIWPAAVGEVRLDGALIKNWDSEVLGTACGYLPQEILLFPGTVAQNIARLEAPDMAEVERVCALLRITDFIATLPEGYETPVGSAQGVRLSGGQRQRIGLARALYGSPSILVLDEPNSNLDEESEAHLMECLRQIRAQGKTTCIIITHKLPLLDITDSILLVHNGEVADYGSRQEVLARLQKPTQEIPA